MGFRIVVLGSVVKHVEAEVQILWKEVSWRVTIPYMISVTAWFQVSTLHRVGLFENAAQKGW